MHIFSLIMEGVFLNFFIYVFSFKACAFNTLMKQWIKNPVRLQITLFFDFGGPQHL